MSSKDLLQNKKDQLQQRTTKRHCQKQVSKRDMLDFQDSTPSDIDQMIISIDDTSDDHLEPIGNIENSNIQQYHGKRSRISRRNFNILGMTSSEEPSICPNVHLLAKNSEESTQLNISYSSSVGSSCSVNFLKGKSTNTPTETSQLSEQLMVHQV